NVKKYFQADHQQTYRERKRRIEKENTASSKRTKEVTDEIIELLLIPKAHIN
ncbi:14064_t:CDS:1, partial [Rhizophagus irregularis]